MIPEDEPRKKLEILLMILSEEVDIEDAGGVHPGVSETAKELENL